MARREYTINLWCAHPGCKERSFSVANTRQEETETRAHYVKHPYRCFRHSHPNEVLSATNTETTVTLTAFEKFHTSYRGERTSIGNYWGETEDKAHQGLMSGPGFRAIGKDFPPGTRLIVTARIEIPLDACTCVMVSPASSAGPEEWDQEGDCPVHPLMAAENASERREH